MPEEYSQNSPEFAAESPTPAEAEKLTDSDNPDVILAQARLLEAKAVLAKASTPLLDKVILRGLLPIALAIVGPWALLKFDASQVEQEKQGKVIVELQDLLKEERKDAEDRQVRSAAWQARMKTIEEEKAAELTAMSTMVVRLDDMLKTALVQMAVSRALGPIPRGPNGAPTVLPSREVVVQETMEQINLPGLEDADLKRMAEQQYDRIAEQRRK